MKYGRRFAVLAVWATLGLSACDSGELNLPALTVSGTWSVDGAADRSFSFTSENDGRISGTLEGTESRGADSAPLSGQWIEGELSVTVQWPGQSVTYTASFDEDNPTSLILVSTQETLMITRG